ncbi:MAG: hypothetical protein NZ576_08405 [Bacteroidia bacterium]|nr:hypothetical protein [Bacteroidia bacterium]
MLQKHSEAIHKLTETQLEILVSIHHLEKQQSRLEKNEDERTLILKNLLEQQKNLNEQIRLVFEHLLKVQFFVINNEQLLHYVFEHNEIELKELRSQIKKLLEKEESR